MISTPGVKISSNQLIRYVPIQLGSKVIKTDLVLLHLEGMDIILGMDWMTKHKVLLDISSRVIEKTRVLLLLCLCDHRHQIRKHSYSL
jgi:hypothetical protein